jgi:hypothetical protein
MFVFHFVSKPTQNYGGTSYRSSHLVTFFGMTLTSFCRDDTSASCFIDSLNVIVISNECEKSRSFPLSPQCFVTIFAKQKYAPKQESLRIKNMEGVSLDFATNV